MPRIEMSLADMQEDYDWAEVFADESSGNTTTDIESPDGTDLSPFTRQDVTEIIALVNGENDGDEWLGVFRLADKRILVATGGCDYTGWDCQAGNRLTVASTIDAAVQYGLTADEAARLGLAHPGQAPAA